jgi:hypothetical protein
MKQDPCLHCDIHDKIACASCWSGFIIIENMELADCEMTDEDLWMEAGIEP